MAHKAHRRHATRVSPRGQRYLYHNPIAPTMHYENHGIIRNGSPHRRVQHKCVLYSLDHLFFRNTLNTNARPHVLRKHFDYLGGRRWASRPIRVVWTTLLQNAAWVSQVKSTFENIILLPEEEAWEEGILRKMPRVLIRIVAVCGFAFSARLDRAEYLYWWDALWWEVGG